MGEPRPGHGSGFSEAKKHILGGVWACNSGNSLQSQVPSCPLCCVLAPTGKDTAEFHTTAACSYTAILRAVNLSASQQRHLCTLEGTCKQTPRSKIPTQDIKGKKGYKERERENMHIIVSVVGKKVFYKTNIEQKSTL